MADGGASKPFTVSDAVGETDDEAIGRLAKLPAIEYERCREAEATRIGARVSILDKLVQAARGGDDATHGRGVALHDPAPWERPVTTADALDQLAAAIRRHVVLPPEACDAVALWIAHTWIFDRFDHSPRLGITSPTKRCGKSTLLEVLRATCRRTLKADNISASGVFRTVEALRPLTMMVDEADSFLRDNEELRGVLNSGFERSGQVIRVVERQGEHVPVMFATYCPVALAAIGDLPGTLADRAIPIRMERKGAADRAEKLRAGGNRAALAEIAGKLSRWASDHGASLSHDPRLPDALNDREGDISVPLIAIADHAGAAWATRGRRALLAVFGLRAANDDHGESGALLLADIKTIFLGSSSLRMTSADICKQLGSLDDRPWPEWRHGKPMTPPQLALALRPFGIRPTTLRIGQETAKGYYREAFEEAWSRYALAGETPSNKASGDVEPLHRNFVDRKNGLDEFSRVTPETALRGKISTTSSLLQESYGVTGPDPRRLPNGAFDDEAAL